MSDMDIFKAEINLGDAARALTIAVSGHVSDIAKGVLVENAIQRMARAADLLGYTLVPKRPKWNDASINGSLKEEPDKCQTLQATECQ